MRKQWLWGGSVAIIVAALALVVVTRAKSARPTDDKKPAVTLELPEHGGHVGFLHGPWPGDPAWLPRRLLRYFTEHLAPAPAGA